MQYARSTSGVAYFILLQAASGRRRQINTQGRPLCHSIPVYCKLRPAAPFTDTPLCRLGRDPLQIWEEPLRKLRIEYSSTPPTCSLPETTPAYLILHLARGRWPEPKKMGGLNFGPFFATMMRYRTNTTGEVQLNGHSPKSDSLKIRNIRRKPSPV